MQHEMQTLDIMIEDQRWAGADLTGLAMRAVPETIAYLNLSPERCEVSLLGCDDARIAVLNADFRNKPTATNVLSWPAEERAALHHGTHPEPAEPGPDGMIELGDIAISFDTCIREADAAGVATKTHVTHLLVHGTLHLLGYDHTDAQDAAVMERLEVEILGKMGMDDPYKISHAQ